MAAGLFMVLTPSMEGLEGGVVHKVHSEVNVDRMACGDLGELGVEFGYASEGEGAFDDDVEFAVALLRFDIGEREAADGEED